MLRSPLRLGLCILLGLALAWSAQVAVAEMGVSSALGREAAGITGQNQGIASANKAYSRDIAALKSPNGTEQQARSEGFTRPGEQVYIVVQPRRTASPSPTAHPPKAEDVTGISGIWPALRRWVSNLKHW